MKKNLTIFFIFIFLYPLIGQEEAVSFDSKGKVWVIDKEVNKTYKLFREDDNVIEARLFILNDSTTILEKLIKKEEKTFRNKQILSIDELNALRHKVDSYSMLVVNQEGRSWLLATSTFLGLTLYGPSVPTIINSDNDKVQVSSYMLTAASGFFLPWYLTRNRPVTYAHLNLTSFGLSWGFIHGAQICWATSGYNDNSALTLGTICGITEGFIGYNVVDKLNISYGQAQLMTFYSEMGLLIGFAAAHRFNIDANDQPGGFHGLSLLGSALGLGIGYHQGLSRSITAGDAQIIGTCAMLSTYLIIPPMADIAPDDSRDITTTLSLASICGAYIGSKLIKNTDFSYGQSLMIGLGTLAGGFTGAGVGYLIDNNSTFPFYISGIGALTSFGLMFNYYKNKSETSYQKNNFRINLYPQNYLVWNQAKLQPIYLTNIPLVSISKSF
jgi:hypothetical protein